MRGIRASVTNQVLEGPKKLSAFWNSEVSGFGSILEYCINSASTGTASSGRISEVAAIESVC